MEITQEKKTSPKDVFIHLLAIVTLYICAVSFLVMVFQYVNILFPDALTESGYYARTGMNAAIRWSIATLVIIFPVYLFTMKFLNKSYEMMPSKRDLRIRKWLIYFTLFVTALVIMGDLVTLINNLLNGELTIRFSLKVLAVLFVTGSIFFYYFTDLKKHNTE
jgi:hypothetical protein